MLIQSGIGVNEQSLNGAVATARTRWERNRRSQWMNATWICLARMVKRPPIRMAGHGFSWTGFSWTPLVFTLAVLLGFSRRPCGASGCWNLQKERKKNVLCFGTLSQISAFIRWRFYEHLRSLLHLLVLDDDFMSNWQVCCNCKVVCGWTYNQRLSNSWFFCCCPTDQGILFIC
jgi:hypothetical protein